MRKRYRCDCGRCISDRTISTVKRQLAADYSMSQALVYQEEQEKTSLELILALQQQVTMLQEQVAKLDKKVQLAALGMGTMMF